MDTWSTLPAAIACILGLLYVRAAQQRAKLESENAWLRQLAAIVYRTGNIVIITDCERRIRWCNAAFEKCTGYSLDQALGRKPSELLQCAETSPATIEAIRQSLASNQSFRGEILNRDRFGNRHWVELDIQPIVDTGGQVVGFTSIQQDITARKDAEQRLFNKQEKLRAIYEASNDGILLFNSAGLFDCNRKSISMFGATSMEQLLGRELWDFAPLEQPDASCSRDKLADAVERIPVEGELRFEFVLSHLDGSTFPVELMLSSLTYDQEPIVQATIRDVTERKQVEARLQAMNRQLQIDLDARTLAEKKIRETTAYLDVYRKIVDHHAIVAETDTRGTILAANDAFCRISGYTREELIGQNHRILNSGLHPKSMWSEMYRTVAKGGCWHGEICNRAKNGQLYWVDTTIAPLFDDAGKLRGYFAIRADITNLKRAQTQAEAANRSKSEFLANMSHEIRTPMTAILGYAEILSELEGCSGCDLAQRAAPAVETIQRNGEHLLAIINDILDISKIEAEKMTIELVPTDLGQLIGEVMQTMQVKATGKGLRLSAHVRHRVPRTIETDPVRLRQILVNLIGNAIKFTECGSVDVTLRTAGDGTNGLLIEVSDTGIGMTSEQLGRLFQAFEQADTSMTRRFGGTGLGLRISKRLAEMLGGDITISCQAGQGCVFTLCIDIGQNNCRDYLDHINLSGPEPSRKSINSSTSPEASADPTLNGGSPNQNPLAGMRILVAEDGPDNQRLITHHLRKAGAEVQLVNNGRLAVELLSEHGQLEAPLRRDLPFDLILMDMQMPEMDGYEATRVLRSKGARLPIYALTAHAMSADLQRCIDAGCNLRLTKPIDRATLINACREARAWSITGLIESTHSSPSLQSSSCGIQG